MTPTYSKPMDAAPDADSFRLGQLPADVSSDVQVVAQSMADDAGSDSAPPRDSSDFRLGAPPADIVTEVQIVPSGSDTAVSASLAHDEAPGPVVTPPKEPDYSETCRRNDPEQPAAPEPTATLDHAAMYKIIRAVARGHSGDAAYAAISTDADAQPGAPAASPARRFGLCFGLLLFSQESGHLGSVLQLMQQRDAAAFSAAFGPQAAALLATADAATADARLQPVEGAPLWTEPWLTRFRTAAANPVFQAAQNEEAIEHLFRPMLNAAFALGLNSDRCLAMALDRMVTRGLGGGLDWIVQACGPLRTFEQRCNALEMLGVESVRDFQAGVGWLTPDGEFGPETHAALVGALREQGIVPLPLPADYEARMLDAADGTLRRRLAHLRRSEDLAGTIFKL
jgi:hypothetical protein